MRMRRTYPQEAVGETLIEVHEDDERRRVFLRHRRSYLEVGEFSRGALTEETYDAPVHYHCVQLEPSLETNAKAFFSRDEPMLTDYMDELDREGVSYGYLNDMAGRYVSYRPARG